MISPVFEVISNIVNNYKKRTEISVYSYKNPEHFNYLWEFLKANPGRFDEISKTFIIIWDGFPTRVQAQDVVDTSKYLTPIDWAVAFSLAVHNKVISSRIDGEKPIYPDLRILILDLKSQSFSHADSVRFFNQFPQAMKWIHLFRPSDAEKLIEVLKDMDKVLSMKDAIDKYDLGLIRNIWAANLTRPTTPGDHHALANIIGPVLLMGDDGSDTHLTALRHLMGALDLIPGNKEGCTLLTKDNAWIKWDELNLGDVLREHSSNLELILIDDQYMQGWGKMLCLAAGTEYKVPDVTINGLQTISTKNNKVTVRATSSSGWMLNKLKGDQRFSLVIDNENTDGKNPEILFLDLRLFSGKNISEEVAFFGKLIPLAKKLVKEANNNLPWPGFSKDEIDLVEEWLSCSDKKREDDIYITALTFLPRIIALTDLSMPIIIFSSTGRRDITEKLKNYGNIITDFDKPKFTVDIPDDIAEQTKGKFQRALEKALLLLQGRLKCRKIIQNASYPKPLETNSKYSHVELYIDEDFVSAMAGLQNEPPDFKNKIPNRLKKQLVYYDGRLELQGWMKEDERDELLNISNDPEYRRAIETIYRNSQNHSVRVGGLFAIFSGGTPEEAQKKADLFDDACTQAGILYFDPDPFQHSSTPIKRKKESSERELATAMGSTNKPEGLFFVQLSFTIPRPDQLRIHSAFDPRSGDNLYRFALLTLLELFLSEVLPALFGSDAKNVSVSIHVATKLKPLAGNDLNMATYCTGQVPSEHSNDFLASISRDSIHPFVLDTLKYHGIERNICRAIGVTLTYKKSKLGGSRKPKYYVCRSCKEQRTIDELARSYITPCSCGNNSFKPDYRALHYIADELLDNVRKIRDGESTGYAAFVRMKPWGFDEKLENLSATIKASHKFDIEDIVGAAIDIDPYCVGITQLLSGRIATEFKKITGWDFCRISVGISDKKAEAINLFRYLKPRVSSVSHPPKGYDRSKKSNIKAVAGNLASSNKTGQDRTQAISNSPQSETIVIIKIDRNKRGTIIECKRNGDTVLVNPKQALKAKLNYNTVKVGDTLKAIINPVDGKLYAINIKLMT